MYSKSDSAKILELAKRLLELGIKDNLLDKVHIHSKPRVAKLLDDQELFDFSTISFDELMDLWCTQGYNDKDIAELFLITESDVIAKRKRYGLHRYGWGLKYLERYVEQEELKAAK